MKEVFWTVTVKGRIEVPDDANDFDIQIALDNHLYQEVHILNYNDLDWHCYK